VGAGLAIGVSVGSGAGVVLGVATGDNEVTGVDRISGVGAVLRLGIRVGNTIEVASASGRVSPTTTGDDGPPDVDVTHDAPMPLNISRRAVSFDCCGWTLIESSSVNFRCIMSAHFRLKNLR
ncbi:MAG: hypothetical protein VB860_04675, partial [Dehalococcoidia bacterium]